MGNNKVIHYVMVEWILPLFAVLHLQEESEVAMQDPYDVARVQHGKEDKEFLVLPTGQERFNLEKLLRYKFNTTDK